VLGRSREAALAARRGSIRLGFCGACGLVYNMAFDPALVSYPPDYESSLHASPRFRAYVEELAEWLVERHDLQGRDIVEIGCGGGEFLALLCRGGRNRGLGFDRSHPASVEADGEATVRILGEDYSEEHAGNPADLICCRHVLEHLADPLSFLRRLRVIAAQAGSPALYFEVPSGLWTLRDLGIWDLIYEHCSYFTPPALRILFVRAGFEVRSIEPAFGGQFLGVEARCADGPAVGAAPASAPAAEIEALRLWIARFEAARSETVASWQGRLETWQAAGHRFAVWGAGSKGVSFLNLLPAARGARLVIDVNPRKQERFVPGTGQRIDPPERLIEEPVDRVVVMNPVYLDEVRGQLVELGSEAEPRSVV
jgi:SAM-dependent methyltransferase